MSSQKETGKSAAITEIKKYSNRRLYNTKTSSYITLDDLFKMVQNNEEFIVLESKTNKNITKSILVQIIFEQENKGYNLLPEDMLKHIICLYGKNISDDFFKFIQNAIASFSENKDKNIIEKISKHNIELFQNNLEKMQNFFGGKKDEN